MRWLLAIAALSLVPAVAAQDGCTQEEPCLWVVDIDEAGISSNGDPDVSWNGTEGDWIQLSVFNSDDVEHTLSLEGLAGPWTIASFDLVESEPFQLDLAGTYELSDAPTGDGAGVFVYANDAVAVQEGEEEAITEPPTAPAGAPAQDAPGLGLLGALVAVGIALRRR